MVTVLANGLDGQYGKYATGNLWMNNDLSNILGLVLNKRKFVISYSD